MRERKSTLLILAVTLLGAAAATTLGASAGLVSIGVLAPPAGTAPASRVYALSPDGIWAVGASEGQNSFGSAAVTQPIIWSATSGLVQLPNPTEIGATAKGVVVLGNGDVGVAALYHDVGSGTPRMHHYTAPPAGLQTGTWGLSPSNNAALGAYNAARNYDTASGLDWSIAGQRGTTGRGIISLPVAGAYSDSGVITNKSMVYNVTSRVPTGTDRGFAAGFQRDNPSGLRYALFGIGGSTQTLIPGGTGYQSEALGMTPLTTATADSGVIVGYDQDATSEHLPHAFYYVQGAAGMLPLSEPAGDDRSTAIDVRVIAGSLIIGGYSSDGVTEKAVLWDKTGTWDASGDPKLLSALLASAGVNVSAWSSLSRITSMSDDGMTLAGWGIWAADGSTRGFVATIPEPGTFILVGFAGLPLLARRRAARAA